MNVNLAQIEDEYARLRTRLGRLGWLPDNPTKQALFDILDDATRYNTGTRLYARETLLSHFDFLPRTFQPTACL